MAAESEEKTALVREDNAEAVIPKPEVRSGITVKRHPREDVIHLGLNLDTTAYEDRFSLAYKFADRPKSFTSSIGILSPEALGRFFGIYLTEKEIEALDCESYPIRLIPRNPDDGYYLALGGFRPPSHLVEKVGWREFLGPGTWTQRSGEWFMTFEIPRSSRSWVLGFEVLTNDPVKFFFGDTSGQDMLALSKVERVTDSFWKVSGTLTSAAFLADTFHTFEVRSQGLDKPYGHFEVSVCVHRIWGYRSPYSDDSDYIFISDHSIWCSKTGIVSCRKLPRYFH